MSDFNEHHADVPEAEPARPAEFARLTEFAQRGTVLAAPERIRVMGMRRLRRRRAGQAVLGTGALAAVVVLGAGFVHHDPGHPASAAAADAKPSGLVVVPGCSYPAVSKESSAGALAASTAWHLPKSVAGSTVCALENVLSGSGFTEITIKPAASDTVAYGNAISIENNQGQSLLNHTVPVSTPLILLVSTGPARQ